MGQIRWCMQLIMKCSNSLVAYAFHLYQTIVYLDISYFLWKKAAFNVNVSQCIDIFSLMFAHKLPLFTIVMIQHLPMSTLWQPPELSQEIWWWQNLQRTPSAMALMGLQCTKWKWCILICFSSHFSQAHPTLSKMYFSPQWWLRF